MIGATTGQRPVQFSGIQVHHWGVDPTRVPLDDRRSFINSMVGDIGKVLGQTQPMQQVTFPVEFMPPNVARILRNVDTDKLDVSATAIMTLPTAAPIAHRLQRMLPAFRWRQAAPAVAVNAVDEFAKRIQFIGLAIHNKQNGQTDLMALSQDRHDEDAFGVLRDDMACYIPHSMLEDPKLTTAGFALPADRTGPTETGIQLRDALEKQAPFIAHRLGVTA